MLKSGADNDARELLLDILDRECLTAELTSRYWETQSKSHQKISLFFQGSLAITAAFAGSTSVVGFWPEAQAPASAATALLAVVQPFLPWLSRANRLGTLAGHWCELSADADSLEKKAPGLGADEIEKQLNDLIDRQARLARDESGLNKDNMKLKTKLYDEILVERGRRK